MGFPWMFKSEQLLGTIERVTTFFLLLLGAKGWREEFSLELKWISDFWYLFSRFF
jgi:hypothetical protein